jgi:hypothetical protein
MIAMVLQRLAITGAGASATAEDSTLVGEVVDSLHSRLRKEGLAPFAMSDVPEWAQVPFADIAAGELLSPYRIGGEAAAIIRGDAQKGRMELARQVAGYRHNIPIRVPFF